MHLQHQIQYTCEIASSVLWTCEVLSLPAALFIPYSAFMSLTDTGRLLDTECNMPCDDGGVKQTRLVHAQRFT